MNNELKLIEEAEEILLHTYNRYQIVLEKGEGVYLFDHNHKSYLDFAAGIAVCALGYSNQEFKEVIKNQVDQLIHTSNLFYNEPAILAGEQLTKAAQLDRVFFTNSGTEAIEGAIKAAKKYAYTKDGTSNHEIIAMQHSFHGRSLGALAVTGNEKYQKPFQPLMPGVKFATFNDIESVKELITDKTCGILLEPIQGEGGIYPAKQQFLQELRQLCDENDILLIFDEIQCGMGRCGAMFTWQIYGVKPDILTVAKALGCGLPIGAFLMTQKVADLSLMPGDHGTTYGGNPLVCAGASAVLSIMEKEEIPKRAKLSGEYLWKQLEILKEEYSFITEHRGMGLMQGLEITLSVSKVSSAALEQGLILITASTNVLRFVPPLVIEHAHIDEMIIKLKKAFEMVLKEKDL